MNPWRRWQGMNVWSQRLNVVRVTLSVTLLVVTYVYEVQFKVSLITVFTDMSLCIYQKMSFSYRSWSLRSRNKVKIGR